MKEKSQSIYRVVFYNNETIYEVYAKEVGESDMFSFIEIADLVFRDHDSLLVDPSVERLKTEFQGVNRFYIPVQSIIRIDEVEKEGIAKIHQTDTAGSNISRFPTTHFRAPEEESRS